MTADSKAAPGAPEETRPQGFLARLRARLAQRPAASARNDIEEALEEISRTDDFTPKERALLRNVLGFRAIRVKDVMIPRADIIAVQADLPLRDLLDVFRSAAHSRLPVYGETLDDPKGMVHIRDFLNHLFPGAAAGADAPEIDLSAELAALNILRPVLYAPPSMPAIELLARMQARRTHMALVVDEYGGTDGLVSIEDLVEVIVGDIEDEHDESDAPMILKHADGSFNANARASVRALQAAVPVPLGDEAGESETIAGLIAQRIGRVPARGEMIAFDEGLEFEILDADARRIKRVKIYLRAPRKDDQAGAFDRSG